MIGRCKKCNKINHLTKDGYCWLCVENARLKEKLEQENYKDKIPVEYDLVCPECGHLVDHLILGIYCEKCAQYNGVKIDAILDDMCERAIEKAREQI